MAVACARENVFWGDGGLGWGNCARRGSLGVMAQVAATAAPALVTAAVPRDLRIDPCERKSKETNLGARDKGALVVVGAGLVGIAVLPSTPGTPRRSSQQYAVPGRGRPLIFSLEFP